jgi:hypothetical protein
MSTHNVTTAQQTYNIVEMGGDPRGIKPIDNLLDNLAGADTRINFPQGIYRLNNPFESYADGLELVGDGAILFPQQEAHFGILLGGVDTVLSGFFIEQAHLDAPFCITMRSDGDWLLEDIRYCGRVDGKTVDPDGYTYVRPVVRDPSRTGTIRNLYLPDGSNAPGEASLTKAIWAGPNIDGTLHIDGLWAESFAENTVYTSNVPGKLIVENAYIRNSNVAGLRVGGNSIIRNCTFVHDGPVPIQEWSGGALQRGIWTNGHLTHGYDGEVLIEDCDFLWTDSTDAYVPLTLRTAPESVVVKDCRIHNTTDRPCVLADDTTLTLDNLQLSGGAKATRLKNVNVQNFDIYTSDDPVTDGTPPLPAPPTPFLRVPRRLGRVER